MKTIHRCRRGHQEAVLLVPIAMIGVLIAILLPVIAFFRETWRGKYDGFSSYEYFGELTHLFFPLILFFAFFIIAGSFLAFFSDRAVRLENERRGREKENKPSSPPDSVFDLQDKKRA